ncbi:MAG: TetR/AcrR family transcriptional regulator [Acidimicrobiia bacterium]|nr:TetR/AcrR family transcriptional regulator [Acidimicrobiia bacterium]
MARKKEIPDTRLLKAAREVFVEKGLGAPAREIARRAKVSEGLLFQRYRTKAELFFAAMSPPEAGLEKLLGKAARRTEFPAQLRRVSMALLDYFRAALPVLVPLMSHPDFQFEEFAERHPQSGMVRLRGDMMEFFRVNQVEDAPAAALLVMSSMQGIAIFEKLGAHGGRMPQLFVDRTVEALIRAVGR